MIILKNIIRNWLNPLNKSPKIGNLGNNVQICSPYTISNVHFLR